MGKKKGNINAYNAQIDRTKTVLRLGRNGILYEYLIPIGGDPYTYYNDATDVKSHNKKTGRYQPVGDKSYFNFYQLKMLRKHENNIDANIDLYLEKIIKELL